MNTAEELNRISISKLTTILDAHERFYESVIDAAMSGNKAKEVLLSHNSNPGSTTDCLLGSWLLEFGSITENTNLEIFKNIKKEHESFHMLAYYIYHNMAKGKPMELFSFMRDFEKSRDTLTILIHELIEYFKESDDGGERSDEDFDFQTCSLSENFDQDDLDLVFFNLGTQDNRSKLINKISAMEYDRAIHLLTLLICLLSKMDRSVDSITEDFDRVSQLRNTLVDIEMQFIASEAKKENKRVKGCESKIDRQLSAAQEADMYDSWMARLEDS